MTSNPQRNFDHKAAAHLSAINERWANLISQVGACRHQTAPHREPYEALIRAVAHQQLTTRAGDAMVTKLMNIHDGQFPSVEQMVACSSATLRQCGFSARKIDTLHAISHGALSGLVPSLEQAAGMDDETLIRQLCSLKGIGRWTVEIFLIYSLERTDIMPLDDLGIRQGLRYVYHLQEMPTRHLLRELSEPCQPYRTIASWYLWRAPALPDYQAFRLKLL
ncbi:DNA-3-methyladenine glycosylase II|uniref:DNA-3-methyladenine glycosylase II n=1 Tax=Brenneria salicis ATCC 15712 = DSM 30166 TaxID=714314 RepID=A0A366HVT0_9GAMM|nr:DNA-3-methyladenine glycosylase [Brenneria salicis]NMN92624.1 DNA-3-methyladenine glycosylase II [Brenneria salicis ATCC 15712 = DSM 30166]RBP57119.1 DNA-3-methyladenine glycosylase II [Brenneria salicis ATCC 15712 = DSM 30166]RLM27885.1 DNA-3-methyladenine glycosylase [Brenneria salicis ATCC 15712 = DSM 30166]